MQCSALPFGVWTGVVLANSGEAPSAAAEERKERRFMVPDKRRSPALSHLNRANTFVGGGGGGNDERGAVIGHWSLVIRHWSFVTGHSSLVIRHWSLVIRHSSFVIRHSSFVTGHSSLVIRHWSLVTGHSPASPISNFRFQISAFSFSPSPLTFAAPGSAHSSSGAATPCRDHQRASPGCPRRWYCCSSS